MRVNSLCVFLISVLLLECVFSLHASQQRAMTPDDLFRLELVDEVAISPDGQWVAYVVKRPKATAGRFGYHLNNWDHADVWLVSSGRGLPQNITNGVRDDSGFWAPKWSPDGRKLAMLSTKGGDVRIWLWSRSSGGFQRLSERGVSLWSSDDYHWVSNDELVFPVLPKGEKHVGIAQATQIAETAEREWAKALKGQEATASVLESGITPSIERRPQSQMLVMNVTTGKERVISTAAGFATVRISPDRRYIAFLRQVGVWRPDSNYLLRRLVDAMYELSVADVHEGFATRAMKGTRDVFWGSLLWSPDSKELAVVGYHGNSSDEREQVFRCRVAEGVCHGAIGVSLDLGLAARNAVSPPLPFLWSGKHELLVHARAPEFCRLLTPAEPWKWWAMDEQGHVRDFLGDIINVPINMLPEAEGTSLIGIMEGGLWRISGDGHPIQNLTPNLGQKITSIEWPQPQYSVGAELIFGVRRSTTNNLYHLDLRSGQVTPLGKPSPEAALIAYHSSSGTIIFTANNRTGTYLWLRRPDREGFTTALETNQFLREIGEGELRKLEYRGLDGQELTAWMILPFGYEEGKRYPVVVWVYAGQMFGNDPPEYPPDQLNQPSPLNLQLLAARGYVVLLPSMPRKPYGEVDDLYMDLTKGVIPAADKLVGLGIADPKRLGLMGQSRGGYSTYGLITQTDRFKAAVALAGLSDLVSLYGTFDARGRYQQFAHENLFRMWNLETSGMGNPPWRDFSRYVRNSPINYVERVHTPVMIIQGDLDTIPIQQGEELFTALYRQNKRASFVRYWGESHVFDSPANIRDMWERIYTWFDEFLKPRDE